MEQNLLSSYGECIAVYSGKGTLTLEDKQALSCTFEAGQLRNGEVILLCDFLPPAPFLLSIPAYKFEGTTSEGFTLSAIEHIMEINYLPDLPTGRSGMWAAFYVRQIVVQIATGVARHAHFGITNFSCTIGLSLELEHAGRLIMLSIKRIKEYSRLRYTQKAPAWPAHGMNKQ